LGSYVAGLGSAGCLQGYLQGVAWEKLAQEPQGPAGECLAIQKGWQRKCKGELCTESVRMRPCPIYNLIRRLAPRLAKALHVSSPHSSGKRGSADGLSKVVVFVRAPPDAVRRRREREALAGVSADSQKAEAEAAMGAPGRGVLSGVSSRWTRNRDMQMGKTFRTWANDTRNGAGGRATSEGFVTRECMNGRGKGGQTVG
jgi:hypothetical protein